jgi:heme/copper-type cytochrome/quinol oxidase subunit 2
MTKRPEEVTTADLAAGERKYHPGGCPLCGYSFRGLGRSPLCPECRYPACMTCEPDKLLRHANKDWLRNVHRWLLLYSVAGVLFIVPWIVYILVTMANRLRPPDSGDALRIMLMVFTLAAPILALLAVYFISRPDPSGVFLANHSIERRLLMPLSALGFASLATLMIVTRMEHFQFARLLQVLASVLVIALCGSALICMVRHMRRLHWQTSSWSLESAQAHKNTLEVVHTLIAAVLLLDIAIKLLPYFNGGVDPADAVGSSCAQLGFPILWACLGFGSVRTAIAHEINPASIPPAKLDFGDMPEPVKTVRDEGKPPS